MVDKWWRTLIKDQKKPDSCHVSLTVHKCIHCRPIPQPPSFHHASRFKPWCTNNQFCVKATITNYKLWTAAPVNLKSLACVVTEIWAKMYLDSLYCCFAKIQWNITMYIARGSSCTHHLLKVSAAAHKVNKLDGCQSAWMRAAPARTQKWRKMAGDFFICTCYGCLQQPWMRYVDTWLTSSHNSVSKAF